MTRTGEVHPKVTFGVIVLNGEPFTRYNLRALYPFAHQIIVAEGAAPGGSAVADPDGHSRDGTLEILRRFKAEEDPDDKVLIVTAEDEGHRDGFWPGEKDEQSRAYARRATGDHLWQVDIDEFYLERDMEQVLDVLRQDPTIDGMTFHQVTFWGGLDYVVDGWYLRRGAANYHRLFKWQPTYSYVTHRPPTVSDGQGRDLREGHWLSAADTTRRGIQLLHYSLLFPSQVREKSEYYAAAAWAQRSGAMEWVDATYGRLEHPFSVHNIYDIPSWLDRYRGEHPEQIRRMLADIGAGRVVAPLRPTDDIERLLRSGRYRSGRALLKALDRVDRVWPSGGRLADRLGRSARRHLQR